MNWVTAVCQGRLPKDADEPRYTAQGVAPLGFSLAVNDAKRPEDPPTEWVRISCWGEWAHAWLRQHA